MGGGIFQSIHAIDFFKVRRKVGLSPQILSKIVPCNEGSSGDFFFQMQMT